MAVFLIFTVSKEKEMLNIRKATTEDISCIRTMAMIVFPETYKDILSTLQIDYMMEWMYSEDSLHKQMSKEGPTCSSRSSPTFRISTLAR